MLSDEEKKEYEELKSLLYTGTISQYGKRKLIDIIEKQSKEIEELRNEVMKKELMIDGMKEDRRIAVEEIQEQYFVSKVESEQKERKAWIKGTNDADELCNKKWEDKIKAKIEEVDEKLEYETNGWESEYEYCKAVLQSLLEKE